MEPKQEPKNETETKKSLNASTKRNKFKDKNGAPTSTSEQPFTKKNLLLHFGSWKKTSTKESPKKSPVAGFSRNGSEENEKNTKINATVSDAGMSKPPTYDEEEENKVINVQMVTEAHAEEYKMNHKRRGKAIILNHEEFEKEDSREGSQMDVKQLKDVLANLKFEVETHNDLDYFQVYELLKNVSKQDFTDCDCIAWFILTHGNKKGEISAKDVYYSVEKLWSFFTPDNCPSLAGKPKLFFINACRGKKKDSGIRFFRSHGRTQTDSAKQESYKIPKHADFLLAYSAVDGFYSYRDIHQGTWFIQCLCDVLREHHNTKDLLKMLTITARKMAVDFTSQSDRPEDCDLKQVSSFTSMLIRDVYFRTT